MNYTQPAEKSILKSIEETVQKELERIGLFSRIFGRLKPSHSIEKKLSLKASAYIAEKKKMQDLFGIRVALYFNDDISLARRATAIYFEELTKDSSIDKLAQDVFGPIRYNVVYRLPDDLTRRSLVLKRADLIDNTFEVQYRSVLSEGWHEVEHDLRYKCKSEWESFISDSRSLNGIYATLENCDNSMIKIFNDLSYSNYIQKNWTAMIRNLFRLRFTDNEVSRDLKLFLNSNPNFAKSLASLKRSDFMVLFLESQIDIPLTYNNIIFLANRFILKNKALLSLESETFSEICEQWIVE